MESYKLQKRIVLSFETGKYEDGETDYTYIVDVNCNEDQSLLVFTLSTGIIRIVKTSDYSNVATINLNRKAVFCSYFIPNIPKFVVCCDQSGFITIINYETQQTITKYQVAKEIYSACLLCGGSLIVTGDKEHLYFNELETGKQIGIYRDIHSDVINHLLSHPVYPTVFASGSEDGLICVFDIARGNQEDSLVTVFQTDSGVANMGWFGTSMDMIWSASMTRGLTVWNTTTGDRLLEITDFYMLLNNQGIEIDYVVGCLSFKNQDELYVLCGNQDGTGYIMNVKEPTHIVTQWKGHQEAIRCFMQIPDVVITCGEDASYCIWSNKTIGKNDHMNGVERSISNNIHKKSGKNAYRSI